MTVNNSTKPLPDHLLPSISGSSVYNAEDHDLSSDVASRVSSDAISSTTSFPVASTKKEQELVRAETLAVKRIKIFLFVAILLAGIGGTAVTFFLVRQAESNDFDDEFNSYAKEIEEVSDFAAKQAFSTIGSLSKAITASSLQSNDMSFPFVTLPYFHEMAEDTRQISGAEVVIMAPLVRPFQKEQWEAYSATNQGWIREGLKSRGLPDVDPGRISEQIYSYKGIAHKHKEGHLHFPDYFLPVWQMAGAPVNSSAINLDLMTRSSFEHTAVDVIQSRKGILSDICDFSYLTEYSFEIDDGELTHPQSYILEPIFESFDEGADIVAFVIAVFPWNNYFKNIFPDNVEGVSVVVKDYCGDTHTYTVNGIDAEYAGWGDVHESRFDAFKYSVEFATFARFDKSHPTDGSVSYEGADLRDGKTYEEVFGETFTEKLTDSSNGHCLYNLEIYPSATLESSYLTFRPALYASAVATLFGFIFILIFVYDRLVVMRQRKLLATAERSKAILSSLFPENVQKRMMEDNDEKQKDKGPNAAGFVYPGSGGPSDLFDSKPIADFFPNTSIMFADLAGFTAWSSTREPTQVFSLLERIYRKFDEIAAKRGVFKVETVGDCYVAATGIPDVMEKHAIVMANFAETCLTQFHKLVRQLEVLLGPDTAELGLRIGIHSGPVTAGVLRGEKSRFQLFGDTMNTTARIESTGEKNRIHFSQETAELLIAAGMKELVKKREGLVVAKGKGEMQTYWLVTRTDREEISSAPHTRLVNDKEKRNIEWNYQNLRRLLVPVVSKNFQERGGYQSDYTSEDFLIDRQPGQTVLDEVKEVITLPTSVTSPTEALIELTPEVDQQLHDYVQFIASLYKLNPFHCFEHASHVTMSVTKLLARIVNSISIDYGAMKYEDIESSTLHDYTYGITSDPLIQFACAFAALIHDADHLGVPNATLVKEANPLAEKYRNQSVAEQNSVDTCWDYLMMPQFSALRKAIGGSQGEFMRFRQLVVNCVMATDIVDKELGALRRKRWETAFKHEQVGQECSPEKSLEDSNRKATIVIEHLIQASDVAHTMQHWHVYLKWNERFFHECYLAYLNGRVAKDPSVGWYEGEIGFFDFYIIPLAKKLKDCGVFGVASDEYLNYAENNRREWSSKGKDIVAGYLSKFQKPQSSSKRRSIG